MADRDRRLEEQLPDYLNGHLSQADVERIEAEMAANLEFRRLVETERRLRTRLLTPSTDKRRAPSFETLAPRLETRLPTPLRRLAMATPLAAAIAVVAMVSYWPQLHAPDAAYETLTDGGGSVDGQRALRVFVRPDVSYAELQLLLNDYDLVIVKRYQPTNAIDVAPRSGGEIANLDQRLRGDARIERVGGLTGEN